MREGDARDYDIEDLPRLRVHGCSTTAIQIIKCHRALAVSGRKKLSHVVIIEDDQTVADLLCRIFEVRGDRCVIIRSKINAVHYLRNVRPDLVLVDYQLIGGIGLQVARIALTRNVPVVVTSGHHNVIDRVHAAGLIFLRKPFTPDEVLDLASRLLDGKSSKSGDLR